MFNFFSQSVKDSQEVLDKGPAKTKQSLWKQLGKAVAGKAYVDEAVLDSLEELLISADVGLETTVKIIERIEQRVARDKYLNTSELNGLVQEEIMALLEEQETSNTAFSTSASPYVILVVGVNGVGKTTTIGKLAAHYQQTGKRIILGAADTFRAAAVTQLQQWGQRVGATVVSKGMHTDPAAVAYDAVKAGIQAQADVVIIDTAGRLHTKVNLMQELYKIRRTISKCLPGAPHEVLLVLDGSTGQNAFVQAKAFTNATNVTALAITKLDGTAKGGVVIGISDQFQVPVRYIGVGERVEDLQVFDRQAFVASLLGNA
ncbi:MAG: signal recognition particle-docking protein FtsY [Bacteroidota bacterium]